MSVVTCPCCVPRRLKGLLIEWELGQIPFGCPGPWGALDPSGWLARVGIQEHGQPGNCMFIEFPFATHVTDPGWEIWHHDQFFAKPGKIRDMPKMHHACRTFIAGERAWRWSGERAKMVHFVLSASCPAATTFP